MCYSGVSIAENICLAANAGASALLSLPIMTTAKTTTKTV